MIDARRLGFAAGILWGLSMFVWTLVAMHMGYGMSCLTMMVEMYPGFEISMGGALVGLIYGFFDGFISLFLLGWIYNKLPKSK